MNIFETIRKVTRGTEQYHSQFLADALADSLNGDRSLFDAVWKLTAPPHWEIPAHAVVSSEERVRTGSVDICIRCASPIDRVVGIEVKTVDASATPGQLERYLEGLKEKYHESDVQIAYLTPFNRERAGDASGSRRTIGELQEFSKQFPQARQLSWLDVADIPWNSNFLWKQHQAYVHEHISASAILRVNSEWNRGFADFFGEEEAQNFWEELALLGIYAEERWVDINLSAFGEDLPSFAGALVRAFEILLESDNVQRGADWADEVSEELRRRFLSSDYYHVHTALFGLSDRYGCVRVQGVHDYNLRIALKGSPDSMSLFRSYDTDRVRIWVKR